MDHNSPAPISLTVIGIPGCTVRASYQENFLVQISRGSSRGQRPLDSTRANLASGIRRFNLAASHLWPTRPAKIIRKTRRKKVSATCCSNLPAVRAAKKVNTLSRVHRRLIEPIDTETTTISASRFSTRFSVRRACPTAIPATTFGCGSANKARSRFEVQAGSRC